MGFLDKARKLAASAQEAAADLQASLTASTSASSEVPAPPASAAPSPPMAAPAPPASADPGIVRDGRPRLARGTGAGPGTAYMPGMLGRAGWRERNLVDPAAVLPIRDRMAAGVPQSTKSEVLEQAFGMGRRWSGGGKSAGLYYQLYPEQVDWSPGSGRSPYAPIPGASVASLPDGRSLVFLPGRAASAVVESNGIDEAARDALARAAAAQLAS